MQQRKTLPKLAPMLAPLLMLLAGCGSVSTSYLPPPDPPMIPALPAVARASQVATPSMCLSTCSGGLTRLRESWLPTPMSSK